jgi:hypothetical protein
VQDDDVALLFGGNGPCSQLFAGVLMVLVKLCYLHAFVEQGLCEGMLEEILEE